MGASTLALALREVRRHLLRSFLTVLGIVIGVAAVVTMVTIGRGATQAVQDQITSLGTNLLFVRPGQRVSPGRDGGAPLFRHADADAIAAQVPGVRAAAPQVGAGAVVVYGARNWSSFVHGSTVDYFLINNRTLADGRIFDETEVLGGAAVCVIGSTVRRELFGAAEPIGSRLRVRQVSCEVIGLMDTRGQGATGQDLDDLVVMPIETVQRRMVGHRNVGTLLVSMDDGADTAAVIAGISQLLRERRHLAEADENNFLVIDTRQLAQTLADTSRVLTALLGAVAAVSLLVGGIGIMNIMLVSVTERTREIGIRLAVGARGRDVLRQFLVEAVTLAALGGLVGLVLAVGASLALTRVMGVPYLFDPAVHLGAFGFAAALGVVFGYLPARRAARLDPIVALRYE